jgi:hypothetical protein
MIAVAVGVPMLSEKIVVWAIDRVLVPMIPNTKSEKMIRPFRKMSEA